MRFLAPPALAAAALLAPPLLGQGGTAVYPGRFYSSGEHQPVDLAVGDLNGDGLPDVIVAHRGTDPISGGGFCSIAVSNGNLQGGLDPAVLYLPGQDHAVSVALGDLTGDGRLDVVTAGGSTVTVFPGNAQGTLDAPASHPTPGSVLEQYLALGDVSGDGRLDVVVVDSADTNAVHVLKGNALGTLDPAVPYVSGGMHPHSVAVGDLTGDGRLDVAVGNRTSATVTVLPGNAAGTLDAPASYPSGGGLPDGLAIGDLTGDGRPDVVVVNRISSAACVLAGNAGGTLDPALCYDTGGLQPDDVVLGDVSGDGRLEVVVANVGSGSISILAGNPLGTLDAAKIHPAGLPACVAVGDLTQDGRLDVVAAGVVGPSNSQASPLDVVCLLEGGASGALESASTYPSGGSQPFSAVVRDVTGDGRQDVVASNRASSTVSVLRRNAQGTLNAPILYGSGGADPTSIAVGDVTGDGRPDVVVANFASHTIGVLAGNAQQTFDPAVAYACGGLGPFCVAIGDVSGDGRPDVVTALRGSDGIGVLKGNAQGTLDPAVVHPAGGVGPPGVAVGDVSGDGRADVVVAKRSNGGVGVLRGHANGTLDPPESYGSGGNSPYQVFLADLDHDGRLDVVVANEGGNLSSLGWLRGNAQGTLEPALVHSTGGGGARAVAVGDVNEDGWPDLLAVNGESNSLAVLRGDASGGLSPAILFASGGDSPQSLALGDLDGNGNLDAVVAHDGSGRVAVLHDRFARVDGIPICFGDGTQGACPCGNSGATGHGCENSDLTGGALLVSSPGSNLSDDDVVLSASGERSAALSIFLQGRIEIGPIAFGDGLRCAGGALKRLYTGNASAGAIARPGTGDLTISARSAALGDPLGPGSIRTYQVYYRDPVAGFCPAPQGGAFNATNGQRIAWDP